MATRTRRSSTKISVSRGPDVASITKIGVGLYGLGIIGTAAWLYTQAKSAGRTMDISDVANSFAWPVTVATGGKGVMAPQTLPDMTHLTDGTDHPPPPPVASTRLKGAATPVRAIYRTTTKT